MLLCVGGMVRVSVIVCLCICLCVHVCVCERYKELAFFCIFCFYTVSFCVCNLMLLGIQWFSVMPCVASVCIYTCVLYFTVVSLIFVSTPLSYMVMYVHSYVVLPVMVYTCVYMSLCVYIVYSEHAFMCICVHLCPCKRV